MVNSGENRLASVDAYVTEPGLHWSMSTGHGDQRQARVRIMLDRLERGRAYGAFTGLTKHLWSSLRSTVPATVPKPVENASRWPRGPAESDCGVGLAVVESQCPVASGSPLYGDREAHTAVYLQPKPSHGRVTCCYGADVLTPLATKKVERPSP